MDAAVGGFRTVAKLMIGLQKSERHRGAAMSTVEERVRWLNDRKVIVRCQCFEFKAPDATGLSMICRQNYLKHVTCAYRANKSAPGERLNLSTEHSDSPRTNHRWRDGRTKIIFEGRAAGAHALRMTVMLTSMPSGSF